MFRKKKPKRALSMLEFRQVVDDYGVISVHVDDIGGKHGNEAKVYAVTESVPRLNLSEIVSRSYAFSLLGNYNKQLEDMR